MATKLSQEESAKSAENSESGLVKPSIFKSNLMIILILFVVALMEMIVAYLFVLPSPEQVRASVEKTEKKEIEKQNPVYKPIVPKDIQEEPRDEVDLGEYTTTEDDSASSSRRLSIHFYGLVNKKELDEYNKRYELNKNRIREAILVILRSSQQAELADPALKMIKNKIMVKVNEILGQPLIKNVLYTDIAVQTGG
ncbi:MAG: flagellar basal body-associated FliL family protein [Planctomycetaceae bacterium]|jgi:flagellar basal body-associated protein FliL|nr:flagellar basal body-associated FliL family protein [Planctomycetaceae bacterium]